MNKLVSVIVPVYNAQKDLPQCVRSLTEQTYADVEILLIDDGSTDESLQLCHRLAEADCRIRVFHQDNSGPSAARNEGLRQAKGQWLLFADADDWLENDAIAKMVSAIEATGAELVIAGYGRFEDGQTSDRSIHLVSSEPLTILEGSQGVAQLFTEARTSLAGVSVWAKLYQRSLIDEHHLSFPENISYEEDCCFNLQYDRFVRKTAVIGQCLYHYRQNTVSLSKGYRPESLPFLLNGYRERCLFFREIGLQSQLNKLDSILLIVMLSLYRKIAMSHLSLREKHSAYAEIIRQEEIRHAVKSATPPKGKVMAAVVFATKQQWAWAVLGIMWLWYRIKY